MANSTGWILAAGALEAANEALFAPIIFNQPPWKNFNWRIVPATAVMAVAVGAIEKLAPKFGTGLGILVFISVILIPYGLAPTPLENLLLVTRGPKPSGGG